MKNNKLITISYPKVSDLNAIVSNWNDINQETKDFIESCDFYDMQFGQILFYVGGKVVACGSYANDVENETVTLNDVSTTEGVKMWDAECICEIVTVEQYAELHEKLKQAHATCDEVLKSGHQYHTQEYKVANEKREEVRAKFISMRNQVFGKRISLYSELMKFTAKAYEAKIKYGTNSLQYNEYSRLADNARLRYIAETKNVEPFLVIETPNNQPLRA